MGTLHVIKRVCAIWTNSKCTFLSVMMDGEMLFDFFFCFQWIVAHLSSAVMADNKYIFLAWLVLFALTFYNNVIVYLSTSVLDCFRAGLGTFTTT